MRKIRVMIVDDSATVRRLVGLAMILGLLLWFDCRGGLQGCQRCSFAAVARL